ncbi:unnamed protein product, partial [Prorocentrum cordatum]
HLEAAASPPLPAACWCRRSACRLAAGSAAAALLGLTRRRRCAPACPPLASRPPAGARRVTSRSFDAALQLKPQRPEAVGSPFECYQGVVPSSHALVAQECGEDCSACFAYRYPSQAGVDETIYLGGGDDYDYCGYFKSISPEPAEVVCCTTALCNSPPA